MMQMANPWRECWISSENHCMQYLALICTLKSNRPSSLKWVTHKSRSEKHSGSKSSQLSHHLTPYNCQNNAVAWENVCSIHGFHNLDFTKVTLYFVSVLFYIHILVFLSTRCIVDTDKELPLILGYFEHMTHRNPTFFGEPEILNCS